MVLFPCYPLLFRQLGVEKADIYFTLFCRMFWRWFVRCGCVAYVASFKSFVNVNNSFPFEQKLLSKTVLKTLNNILAEGSGEAPATPVKADAEVCSVPSSISTDSDRDCLSVLGFALSPPVPRQRWQLKCWTHPLAEAKSTEALTA